jgi:diguanylate cyclase (GGDEF)-like protein
MATDDKGTCGPPMEIDPQSLDLNDLRLSQLRACVDVSKAITAELNPDRLIPTIMEKVSKLLPSENWSLFLLDDATRTLKFEISVDIDIETVKNFRLKLGQGVAGQAALTQRVLVVDDVSRCDFFFDKVDGVTGRRTKALICVPILYAGRAVGVLEVVNPKSMDPTVLPLLNLLADYLAIAIENTRRYKLVEDMAVKDSLTGLYNQRYLYPALQRYIRECGRYHKPLSLVFADMDDFKEVVDRLGHLNGSRALSEVAQRIGACVTEPAFAVAYGGDEFVLVLPELGRAQAVEMADTVRRAISATPYLCQWGHDVMLTASFGVATFPEDAADLTALLALADKAMFRVKTSGKDRVDTSMKLDESGKMKDEG